MALSINIDGTTYAIEGEELATESTLRALAETMNTSFGKKESAAKRKIEREEERRKKVLEQANDEMELQAQILAKMNSGGGFMSGIKDTFGKVTSFLGPVFSALGAAFGALVSVVSAAYGAMEKAAQSMAEVYNAGVKLQGGLFEFVRQAALAGVPLSEFTKIIVKNQLALARFGAGSVAEGTKRVFALAQSMAIGKENMAGLGLTISQVAEYLLDYSDILLKISDRNILLNDNSAQSQEMIRKKTLDYAIVLGNLAAVTGSTRDEMNQFIKDLSKDSYFTADLSKYGDENRENILKFTAGLTKLGGPEMQTLVSNFAQYGQPIGSLARALGSFPPLIGQTLKRAFVDVSTGAKTADQALGMLTDELADPTTRNQVNAALQQIPNVVRDNIPEFKAMATFLQTAISSAGANTKRYEAYIKERYGITKKWDTLSLEERRKYMEEESESRTDENTMVEKFNQSLEKARGVITTALVRIFNAPAVQRLWDTLFGESGILNQFAESLLKVLGKDNLSFMDIVKGIWQSFKTAFSRVYDELIVPALTWIKKFFVYMLEGPIQRVFGQLVYNLPFGKSAGLAMQRRADLAEAKQKMSPEDTREFLDLKEMRRTLSLQHGETLDYYERLLATGRRTKEEEDMLERSRRFFKNQLQQNPANIYGITSIEDLDKRIEELENKASAAGETPAAGNATGSGQSGVINRNPQPPPAAPAAAPEPPAAPTSPAPTSEQVSRLQTLETQENALRESAMAVNRMLMDPKVTAEQKTAYTNQMTMIGEQVNNQHKMIEELIKTNENLANLYREFRKGKTN